MRLLLVEDDQMLADGIRQGLTGPNARYVVDHVGSAEAALDALTTNTFDAAIIDIGLPGMDGIELAQCIRQRSITIPLMMLTARDALSDRVNGLDAGADDYMVKPFELDELLARLRALLRRSKQANTSLITLGPVVMDTANYEVLANGVRLDIRGREWTVLHYLMLHTPKPVNKYHIWQTLTGREKEITLNAVEVYVSRLRTKLAPYGIVLHSIRGFGYHMEYKETEYNHPFTLPPTP